MLQASGRHTTHADPIFFLSLGSALGVVWASRPVPRDGEVVLSVVFCRSSSSLSLAFDGEKIPTKDNLWTTLAWRPHHPHDSRESCPPPGSQGLYLLVAIGRDALGGLLPVRQS